MLNIISIIIGKIIIKIGKPLGKSSSLPGVIILKINKKIFDYFKLPSTVIAVTGSSGKGSTSSLISKILRQNNYTVAHNYIGSNLTFGILTLLLENTKLNGKINKDILIYEVDERYTKEVFKNVKPNYLIITNITRDQPPRQGHFDVVFDVINNAITEDMHLILNGDDPFLQKFVINKKNEVTYYGIEKNKFSYEINKFENLNINYCPICNNKISYNYYNFENTGDYYCDKCGFKRPNINYMITNIDYDNSQIQINNKYYVTLNSDILYSIYNNLAAFSLCSVLNIDQNKMCDEMSKINKNKKLLDIYENKKRKVIVLNNKNENASTFNQSLLYLTRYDDLKTIVIGWKEISRRYNFDDLSWLYDINFELLNKMNIEKIICVGIHRYDIAVRIKYSDIDIKKIEFFDKLEDATEFIKNKTEGNIYAVLNFDYVRPFNQLMLGSDKL
ncbi:MAG: MurT ligase domain-containing protein [Bacilli bacterium]|nr:MurT ligase domain-containing protein [Bacilli bacterium]